jgi:hypothetical protein
VTDVEHAKEIIRSTGLLELKIVEGGPAANREDLMQNGQVPKAWKSCRAMRTRRAAAPFITWCARRPR